MTGTIVETADLGIPALPAGMGATGSDLTSLVAGSHTLRVWAAGAHRFRLSLQDQLGEYDVIRDGSSLWTWSSKSKEATRHTIPAHVPRAPGGAAGTGHDSAGPIGTQLTPQQATSKVLHAVDPSTQVTTSGTDTVAGRSAYLLELTPKTPDTLIGSVQISVDSATHVPLRVAVLARGATSPSFEVGFTAFDPHTPPASVFAFNPPPGTKVTRGSGDHPSGAQPTPATPSKPGAAYPQRPGTEKTTVVGKDWSTVVLSSLPKSTAAKSGSGSAASTSLGSLGSYLGALPKVSGTWGSGHLLRGPLFSVLVTDTGRVAVGAVPPQQLYDALTAPTPSPAP